VSFATLKLPMPYDLNAAALQTVTDNGFHPQFPPEADAELASLTPTITPGAVDLRGLLWSSIDNDTSRDLDQIEVAEQLSDGRIRVLVGIADVDAYVRKGLALDTHAKAETTSVYAEVRTFPMLPEKLSTGLTSLLENGDRAAIVTEYIVGTDGGVTDARSYAATVRNKAQLTYNGVGPWLDGKADAPPKVAASPDLQTQLKLQNTAAQRLLEARHRLGALSFERTETIPVFEDGQVIGLVAAAKNSAGLLIENFMVAANEAMARTFVDKKVSSIRRVVSQPARWDRIVELAKRGGGTLPTQPDVKALNDFLLKRKEEDPDHYADLSLSVIKLLGPGEYKMQRPGDDDGGHFSLAAHDYTHSTAPNRRFADVVTQRILKALGASAPAPYSDGELNSIATHCTEREDAARKVERTMQKRIAAVAMSSKVGQTFLAIATGVSEKGTFVRVIDPPMDGRLMQGIDGIDVGDKLEVRLTRTDPARGFIDFAKIRELPH
jgi:VacB/RNase II family 3'-5' exoribonuclease